MVMFIPRWEPRAWCTRIEESGGVMTWRGACVLGSQ